MAHCPHAATQPLVLHRPSALQYDPAEPLLLTEAVWSDMEERMKESRHTIATLEMHIVLLNFCGAAANAANAEVMAANAEAGLAEAKRRLEAVPAGDEAARQAAQVGPGATRAVCPVDACHATVCRAAAWRPSWWLGVALLPRLPPKPAAAPAFLAPLPQSRMDAQQRSLADTQASLESHAELVAKLERDLKKSEFTSVGCEAVVGGVGAGSPVVGAGAGDRSTGCAQARGEGTTAACNITVVRLHVLSKRASPHTSTAA